jgi:hypothetical protein
MKRRASADERSGILKARPRIDERGRPAAPQRFARGARVDGGQRLDQGRLAGAVLADDGVDFAFLEGEVHRLQRVRRAEALVQLLERENGDARSRRWRRAI